MKQIKIPWDKYEAALLIETYLKIQNSEVSRTIGLQNLSSILRLKALHEGKQIDNYFRNYNGMCFMINCIAKTFHPNKYSIHGSNLFTSMVDKYKTDINRFNEILNEAHELVGDLNTIKYVMHSKYGYGIIVAEKMGILDIKFDNLFDLKHIPKGHETIKEVSQDEYLKNVIIKDLEISDNSEEEFNKGILIEEKIDCSDYQVVLNKCFTEGFSYNNPIQKRKFIRLYNEELGKNFIDSDQTYLKKITNVGFVCDNRVYPLSIVSESLKDEIQKYIDSNLNNESPAIYYNSLFDVFRNSLSEIFDENMLKGYISLAFRGKYNFESNFISIKGQAIDLRQCLIELFMKFGKPLYKEEIYRELPNISPEAVDALLTDKDFVLNFRGKSYFYIDIFNINDDELKDIEIFISEKIREKEQLTGSELYEYVQECLPNVIESNPEVTDLGVRNAIREHFRDKFRFKGDLISSLDNKVNVKTLYENFCKNHERFSFEELEGFRDSIRQSYIDYEAVFSKMIRINQDEFIRRDLVNFDIDRIDNALLNYCGGEYISFNDIINFTDFPSIQYLWNNYVLESYLYCCSRKFKLVHATFNKEMPVGGIVKKISNIETFDDLLVRVIKENKLFDKDKAFEFLLENKIILTRKVKNIDILIEKAKQEV